MLERRWLDRDAPIWLDRLARVVDWFEGWLIGWPDGGCK
jgi:hypothetical protein